MAASIQPMTIKRIMWNVAGGTLELTLQSQDAPPRPTWVAEDQWYGGAGESVQVTIPVGRRLNATPSTGIGLIGQDANGENIYMRYTWNGTAWVNPVRVDPGTGQPI